MTLPTQARYVIIGAGIHGLSTAYHLALELKSKRLGSGKDIVVLEKSHPAAGASGIACGVVRNNYFQPAMRELMAHSVEIWDSDPENYSYHPVGYMQISPESMRADVAGIYQQQADIGYESVLIDGPDASQRYMEGLFHDWQAQGITSVLHEKKGGYSNQKRCIQGLLAKVEAQDVRVLSGVTVTGFQQDGAGSNSLRAVETDQGVINCEFVVIAVGPWVKSFWDMLELPATISIKGQDGNLHENIPMWAYWSLQEGVLGVDPDLQKTNDGQAPPVVHVDTDAPLYSCVDGTLITDQMWGIYYKPDFHFNGVQGGAMPFAVPKPADEVNVDPYGPESPEFIVGDEFAKMWVSGLAHCQKRFERQMPMYRKEPSGGIGCLTPDSFPVFDYFRDNCYIIADSNHGWKMIGVGKLVAAAILGRASMLLKPFRFERYVQGDLHPVSNSPYPWS